MEINNKKKEVENFSNELERMKIELVNLQESYDRYKSANENMLLLAQDPTIKRQVEEKINSNKREMERLQQDIDEMYTKAYRIQQYEIANIRETSTLCPFC